MLYELFLELLLYKLYFSYSTNTIINVFQTLKIIFRNITLKLNFLNL